MPLRKIKAPLNDGELNKLNHNFEYLSESHRRLQTQINDLVLESGGDSNLEVVQARGGYRVLNDRLDAVDSQLAQTTDLANALNSSKADKGYVDGLAEQKRDKSVPIKMADLHTEVKESMTGGAVAVVGENAVGEENLKDESATSRKRTPLGERASIVAANGIPDVRLTEDERALVFSRGTVFYAGNRMFQLENVEKVIPLNTSATHHYIYINIKNGSFVELNSISQLSNLSEDMVYVATLTIPNATLLRSIDIGCDYTVNNQLVSRITDGGIKESHIDNWAIGNSHLKDKAVTSNKRTNLGTVASIICGSPYKLPNFDMENKTLQFFGHTMIVWDNNRHVINSEQSDVYEIDFSEIWNETSATPMVYFNTEDKIFRVYSSVDYNRIKQNDIFVCIINRNPDSGELLGIDAVFSYTIDGQSPFADCNNENKEAKDVIFSEVIPTSYYEPTADIIEGYEVPDNYEYVIPQEEIYSVYDTILAENPDWATKTELGLDQSGTYNIYKYEFIPYFATHATLNLRPRKIIIIAGTHGEEKASVVALRNFIRDVAENWRSNELLEYVRHNIHFVIIPILNPWGFENHTRVNSRGVDLNRNNNFKWEEDPNTDPTSDRFKGTSPASEAETQFLAQLISDNLDADLFFDFHMNGSSGDAYHTLFLTSTNDNFSDKPSYQKLGLLTAQTVNGLTRYAQKKGFVPESSGRIGNFAVADSTTSCASYAYSQGIPGYTVEVTRKLVGEENIYSADTINLDTTAIGNLVMNSARIF